MGYPFSSSSPDEGRDQVLTNFEDPRDCQMTGRKIGGGGTGRPSIRVTTGKRRVVISMLTRNHLVFARRKKQSIEMLAAGATTDEVSAWVKNDEEAECCCLIRQRMGRRGQPTVGDVIRLIDSLSVLPGRKEISAKRKKDQRSALRRLARYAIEFRLKLNLPPEVKLPEETLDATPLAWFTAKAIGARLRAVLSVGRNTRQISLHRTFGNQVSTARCLFSPEFKYHLAEHGITVPREMLDSLNFPVRVPKLTGQCQLNLDQLDALIDVIVSAVYEKLPGAWMLVYQFYCPARIRYLAEANPSRICSPSCLLAPAGEVEAPPEIVAYLQQAPPFSPGSLPIPPTRLRKQKEDVLRLLRGLSIPGWVKNPLTQLRLLGQVRLYRKKTVGPVFLKALDVKTAGGTEFFEKGYRGDALSRLDRLANEIGKFVLKNAA